MVPGEGLDLTPAGILGNRPGAPAVLQSCPCSGRHPRAQLTSGEPRLAQVYAERFSAALIRGPTTKSVMSCTAAPEVLTAECGGETSLPAVAVSSFGHYACMHIMHAYYECAVCMHIMYAEYTCIHVCIHIVYT